MMISTYRIAMAIKGAAAIVSGSGVIAAAESLHHPYNVFAASAIAAVSTFVNWASAHKSASPQEATMADAVLLVTVKANGKPVYNYSVEHSIPEPIQVGLSIYEAIDGGVPPVLEFDAVLQTAPAAPAAARTQEPG